MMDPGQPESNAAWVMNGPFRLYETGSARDLNRPVYYADYMQIPDHPELNNTDLQNAHQILSLPDVLGPASQQ